MIQSIVVVCVGNICRSPAAEKLFQHKLPDKFSVSSAGLGAMVDHPIEPDMQQCLLQSGLTELEHKARQFTLEIAQQADLILAMERAHIARIVQIAPHAHGKTLLLGKWAGDIEIADPYMCSAGFFQEIYTQIDRHVGEWAEKLK